MILWSELVKIGQTNQFAVRSIWVWLSQADLNTYFLCLNHSITQQLRWEEMS